MSVIKTDDEWREQLTAQQYRVARQGGTERAFTGAYWNHKEEGIYECVCCRKELFRSAAKFQSGTGWPSFYAPIEDGAVRLEDDYRLLMRRREVLCADCGAHLGHVFDDGPEPTGQRWCNNGLALQFVPKGKALPELRV